jgi:quinoprotein relay system zinc metallohydrolase 1
MKHGLWGLLLWAGIASAELDRYTLMPQRVAEGVYVFEGARELFSRDNGGDIANTGVIHTPEGNVVIDTGPSKRYGEAQRAAIAKVTGDARIAAVYLTHAHPDHFLGNQAYADAPVFAAPETARVIREQGPAFTDTLYRWVGPLMAGTVSTPPRHVAVPGPLTWGDRPIDIHLHRGHSETDLVVFDVRTGTLFTGDLVFFNRTLTTPSADIPQWLESLAQLQKLPFKRLVPGHGPVVSGPEAIAQTRDYLQWLTATLEAAAGDGHDIPELLRIDRPERFAALALFEEEFERTVVHLYPQIEQRFLVPVQP